MKMKLRVFVTMFGSLLVAAWVVAVLAGVAEARPTRSQQKKVAQKPFKKSAARTSVTKKKISAEKKREHAELVAKLKNEEQKSKEREANSPVSIDFEEYPPFAEGFGWGD